MYVGSLGTVTELLSGQNILYTHEKHLWLLARKTRETYIYDELYVHMVYLDWSSRKRPSLLEIQIVWMKSVKMMEKTEYLFSLWRYNQT